MSGAMLAFHTHILPSGHSARCLWDHGGDRRALQFGCQDRAPGAGGVWTWHSWALCRQHVTRVSPLPAWMP